MADFVEPEFGFKEPEFGNKPAPTSSALGEIGTGLKRGALVGLPTMVGKALQYTSEPGRAVYGLGESLAQSAEQRGLQPGYQLRPEQHGKVINVLAQGAEAAAPMLPAIAATLASGGALGVPAMVATAAGMAGEAGQTTLEKAKAKGIPEDEAKTAARLNAAQTFGVQTALGAVGGKLLGVTGSAVSKAVGRDAGEMAASTLDVLAGRNGIVKPLLKQTAISGGEAVALGATQAAAQAEIEKRYGVDEVAPYEAAKESIVPMIGLTAIMTPLGLAGRVLGMRAAKGRTDALSSADTHPEARGQLAEQYAAALERVNPEAAENFRGNAKTAIEGKLALPVDSTLFTKDVIQPDIMPAAEAPRLLENRPSPRIVFPDGTVADNWKAADDYLASLPEEQRLAARAKLFGFEPQVAEAPTAIGASREELVKRGVTPEEPLPFSDVASALKEEARKQGVELNQKDLADIYQQHQQEIERANFEKLAPKLMEEPTRLNSQISDAMERAQDEQTARTRAIQVEEAYRAAEAGKEQQLTAIQNIAKGEELARAAEQGKPIEAAITLPLPHNDFITRLSDLKEPEQNMPPKLKQELAQAIRGKDSLDAQVDALGALRDSKKENSGSFELLDKLHKQLIEERGVPEKAVEAPAKELSVRDSAQVAADKLDATIASFNDRARAGEKLTALEQERMDDANNFRKIIAQELQNPNANEAYLKDLTEFATQTEIPYAKSFSEYKAKNPEERNVGMVSALAKYNNVSDLLTHISDNSSAPWVKELAEKYKGLGLNSTIELTPKQEGSNALGNYDYAANHITIRRGGESEHVVLHEITHAATAARVEQAKTIAKPTTQLERQLQKGYQGLEQIRQDALQKSTPEKLYGLTDVHELLAEVKTNPEFQTFLKQQGGRNSLWDRFVDAVRNLVGMEPKYRNDLEKALGLSESFFSAQKFERPETPEQRTQKFESSYKSAADITDQSLKGVTEWADKVSDKIDLKTLSRAAFEKLMGLKTTAYIADRVRANPEMVASGLAAGLDSHIQAHEIKKLAASHIGDIAGHFERGVDHIFRAVGGNRARDLSMQMMRLGGESSLLGFDITKNFNDNLAERPGLSQSNKAYIDGLHREFMGLQKTNPDAAKAILEGAKISRNEYVSKAATIATNLMDYAVTDMRRLEAELQRMDPADQNRARLVDALKGATYGGTFALKHGRGLDFMDKALQNERNGDPSKHISGASYALDQRVRAMFADAKNLPEGNTLKSQLGEMEKVYNNQVDNPYYSLGRNGDYFVKVGFRNMDDATWTKLQGALKGTNKILGARGEQDYAFFKVDTLDQAQGLLRKLQQAGGDKVVDTARGKTTDADALRNSAGLNAGMRSILDTLHNSIETTGIDPTHVSAMKDAMTRQFMSLLPETSAQKSMMRRQGIPGYDGDFLGNFSRRASSGIHDTANVYSARKYAQSFNDMKNAIETLNRTGDADTAARAQIVYDEISRKYNNELNPIDSKAVDMMHAFGHTFYLAASPGYILRNTMQPWHRSLPEIGARFGFVSGAKELAGATGTAIRVLENTIRQGWKDAGMSGVLDGEVSLKGLGLKPNEEAFIQELHDRGILNLGQTRQVMQTPMPGRLGDTARFVSMFAQGSEMTNRLTTGLAAFRLAEKNVKPGAESTVGKSTEYAIKIINDTLDNFESSNTARQISKHGFAGKVTPLMTQFMNYNMQTMQQIARTIHDGVFNIDKSPEGLQRAKEARREFAGLMGTSAMIAGGLGLPFVNALAGVYNWATKDEDNPSDIRTHAKNTMTDIFGQEFGNVLLRGVPSLLGADTSTFGLADVLPGTSFLDSRRMWKDRVSEQSKQLLGPAINAGLDIAGGLEKISDGNYVKGIASMLPSGIRSYYKAADLAAHGYTDAKGNPIGIEATPWDVVVQAAGIQPATKAINQEAASDFYTNQSLLARRKDVIKDQFYKAYTTGDAADKQEANQALADFNVKNPYQPITDLASVFRQHAIELATAKQTGLGFNVAARKLPLVTEQERFAAFPKP